MATFYVDTGGNDSTGDGSSGNAWATLSHACGEVGTGDTIHINAGTYTDNSQCTPGVGVTIEGTGSGSVTINTTRDAYILLASNPSGPVVAGSNEISGVTIDGGGACDVAIRSYGRSNQVIHDCVFVDCNGGWPYAGIQISGKYGYDGNGDFARYAAWSSGHSETCSYYDAAGDKEHNIPPASTDYATGVEIYNNTFTDCSLYLMGALQGMSVHDNTIDNTGTTYDGIGPTGIWFSGGEIYDNSITLGATTTATIGIELWEPCANLKVYGNTSNAWFSLGGQYGNTDNGGETYSYQCYNNTINSSIDSGDPHEAIECMAVSNVQIYGNYVTGADAFNKGVAIWGGVAGDNFTQQNITIRNNVFYNLGGDVIYIAPTANNYDIQNVYIYNNVIDTNTVGQAIVIWQGDYTSDVDNVVVKNNVVRSCSNMVLFGGTGSYIGGTDPIVVKYNFYYDTTGPVTDWSSGGGTSSASNNTETDAELVKSGSRPSPYYRPASSAANVVDAGTDVGLSYEGTAPEIGRYEYPVPSGGSDFLKNELLDHVLKTGAYSAPTNIYVALYTEPPGSADSGTEVSGGGYSRVTHNSWDAASSGVSSNTGAITFATATSAWGAVVAVGLLDASAAGNILVSGHLTMSKTVSTGDKIVFADGAIDITLT